MVGGFAGFTFSGMALLIAGFVLLLLLGVAAMVFDIRGPLSALAQVPGQTLATIWLFLSQTVGLGSSVYFAIHPDRL